VYNNYWLLWLDERNNRSDDGRKVANGSFNARHFVSKHTRNSEAAFNLIQHISRKRRGCDVTFHALTNNLIAPHMKFGRKILGVCQPYLPVSVRCSVFAALAFYNVVLSDIMGICHYLDKLSSTVLFKPP